MARYRVRPVHRLCTGPGYSELVSHHAGRRVFMEAGESHILS